MSKLEKLNDFAKWLKKNDPQVEYSSLWEIMKKSFEGADEVHRGYAINNERDFTKLERALIGVKKIENFITKFQRRFFILICCFVSFLYTGSRSKYRKYGLHYGTDIKEAVFKNVPGFQSFYQSYCNKFGEYYSYSGMRVLFYYFLCSNLILNKTPKIFEIGAGLGNFSIITSRHYEKFEYVILDIPEIIPTAYANVKELVTEDTELYLPNELDDFNRSSCSRKILWIVPSQITQLEKNYFDFFCNTESFAEMDPTVSETYWSKVALLLKDGCFAFLVNRAIRFTDSAIEYSSMSSPFKLNNPYLKVQNVKVDEFRATIPQLYDKPNLVVTYKVAKSTS